MERRLQIMIWAAFLIVPLMYYLLMRKITPASPTDNPNLVLALNVGALVLVAISFLAKRAMSARAAAGGSAQTRQIAQLLPLSLCTAGALCGLIAWFTTASPLSFYPLIFGFAGVLLHFPQASEQS